MGDCGEESKTIKEFTLSLLAALKEETEEEEEEEDEEEEGKRNAPCPCPPCPPCPSCPPETAIPAEGTARQEDASEAAPRAAREESVRER